MIVIDTSAITAILQEEPEQFVFRERISVARRRLISAVTYQEAGQVAFGRRGSRGRVELDAFLFSIAAEIIPHDETLARMAIDAFQRFGKGIHSKARLNFGDCAAYALAASLGVPLLFKGTDFAATDALSAT
jgi:ribonuclease VapC